MTRLVEQLPSINALSHDFFKEGTECCTITRWMPEFFDDILWSHTHKLLLEHPGPSLSYPSQETTPYSNQGHSPIVVAKREQGKKTSVLQKSSKVGMVRYCKLYIRLCSLDFRLVTHAERKGPNAAMANHAVDLAKRRVLPAITPLVLVAEVWMT